MSSSHPRGTSAFSGRRTVECPSRRCFSEVAMDARDLCQHMISEHGDTTKITAEVCDKFETRFHVNMSRFVGPANSFDHSWIYDGLRFFGRLQQIYPIWYSWVYVLAPTDVASRYFCQITIRAKRQDHEPVAAFEGPVHSVAVPKKDIRADGNGCLQLRQRTMRSYAVEDAPDDRSPRDFNAWVMVDFRVWDKRRGGGTYGGSKN